MTHADSLLTLTSSPCEVCGELHSQPATSCLTSYNVMTSPCGPTINTFGNCTRYHQHCHWQFMTALCVSRIKLNNSEAKLNPNPNILEACSTQDPDPWEAHTAVRIRHCEDAEALRARLNEERSKVLAGSRKQPFLVRCQNRGLLRPLAGLLDPDCKTDMLPRLLLRQPFESIYIL